MWNSFYQAMAELIYGPLKSRENSCISLSRNAKNLLTLFLPNFFSKTKKSINDYEQSNIFNDKVFHDYDGFLNPETFQYYSSIIRSLNTVYMDSGSAVQDWLEKALIFSENIIDLDESNDENHCNYYANKVELIQRDSNSGESHNQTEWCKKQHYVKHSFQHHSGINLRKIHEEASSPLYVDIKSGASTGSTFSTTGKLHVPVVTDIHHRNCMEYMHLCSPDTAGLRTTSSSSFHSTDEDF